MLNHQSYTIKQIDWGRGSRVNSILKVTSLNGTWWLLTEQYDCHFWLNKKGLTLYQKDLALYDAFRWQSKPDPNRSGKKKKAFLVDVLWQFKFPSRITLQPILQPLTETNNWTNVKFLSLNLKLLLNKSVKCLVNKHNYPFYSTITPERNYLRL